MGLQGVLQVGSSSMGALNLSLFDGVACVHLTDEYLQRKPQFVFSDHQRFLRFFVVEEFYGSG